MSYPPVVIVDEHDTEISTASLQEAWRDGLCHRIVSVFVQDDQGRMLLQLRGSDVAVYPNCWDQAAGGHVDAGQTYDQASRAELREETGITGVPLTVLGTFRTNRKDGDRTVNQFERVYLARIPHDTPLQPDGVEVHALTWFAPEVLKLQIAGRPEIFTPGLLYCLQTYFTEYI